MEQDLKMLDKQAIAVARKYAGQWAPATVAVAIVLTVAYGINLWLFVAGVTPLWLSTLLLAALTYLAYTPLHEAAHGNIRGNRDDLKWVEDITGFVCAQIIFLPHSTHRLEHMVHHRYTNDPQRDPDYLASEMGSGWWSFFIMTLRFYWRGFTFGFSAQCTNATVRDKLVFLLEVLVAVAWRVALLWVVSVPEWLMLIVGGYLGAVFFIVYWFAYRPHHPYEEVARYRNTSSFVMPLWLRPMRWFWMGQDLHAVHHLFPRVPFYRYRQVFSEVEPILRAHGSPIIGIFSREPVPAARP